MRVGIVIAMVVAMLGCKKSADRATQGTAGSATISDDAMFARWTDSLERQVEMDARAGATRTFATADEANAYLMSLTPSGFHPRLEFFGSLATNAADLATFSARMAAFAQANDDRMSRWSNAFMTRLQPLMEPVVANIHRQFPSATTDGFRPHPAAPLPPTAAPTKRATVAAPNWPDDPVAALIDGKQHQRATFVLFCATWVQPCSELYANLADPAIHQELTDRFSTARIDMTDDAAPHIKDYAKRFDATALPLMIVFDATGQEAGRHAGILDVAGLHALLGRAH